MLTKFSVYNAMIVFVLSYLRFIKYVNYGSKIQFRDSTILLEGAGVAFIQIASLHSPYPYLK